MKMEFGITRIVFLIGPVAIKIPQWRYEFRHFIAGFRCNKTEVKIWRKTRSDLLCPVLFGCSLFVLMKRANCDKHLKEIRAAPTNGIDETQTQMKYRYSAWTFAGFSGDIKPDNFGYIGTRLVKIDYGHDQI